MDLPAWISLGGGRCAGKGKMLEIEQTLGGDLGEDKF